MVNWHRVDGTNRCLDIPYEVKIPFEGDVDEQFLRLQYKYFLFIRMRKFVVFCV